MIKKLFLSVPIISILPLVTISCGGYDGGYEKPCSNTIDKKSFIYVFRNRGDTDTKNKKVILKDAYITKMINLKNRVINYKNDVLVKYDLSALPIYPSLVSDMDLENIYNKKYLSYGDDLRQYKDYFIKSINDKSEKWFDRLNIIPPWFTKNIIKDKKVIINLSWNNITNLKSIQWPKNIVGLDLSNNKLKDIPLTNLPINLKVLVMKNNDISLAKLQEIKKYCITKKIWLFLSPQKLNGNVANFV